MNRSQLAALSVVATLARSGVAQAQGVTFSHSFSVYGDGKEKEVALNGPEGVACTDSTVVVADTGNRRLLVFGMKAGRPDAAREIKLAQLTVPMRVQIDSKGNVLALDARTHRIVRVDSSGGFGGYVAIGEPAGPGSMPVIAGFKLDGADNVYALELTSGKVLVADPSGKITRQLELPRGGAFTDVAVDLGGTIFVVDAVSATVWSADKAATAFKALTPAMKDRMNFPVYATASKGKLFLVDQFGSGIVLLGTDGAYMGRQLSIGWSEGLVNYPAQLCVSESGDAYVADRFNSRVQAFTLR